MVMTSHASRARKSHGSTLIGIHNIPCFSSFARAASPFKPCVNGPSFGNPITPRFWIPQLSGWSDEINSSAIVCRKLSLGRGGGAGFKLLGRILIEHHIACRAHSHDAIGFWIHRERKVAGSECTYGKRVCPRCRFSGSPCLKIDLTNCTIGRLFPSAGPWCPCNIY